MKSIILGADVGACWRRLARDFIDTINYVEALVTRLSRAKLIGEISRDSQLSS